MDFEKTLSIKLREYFNNKLKLLFITKDRIIILTNVDKVYEFERNLKTLLEFNKNVESFIESKIVNELCFKEIIDFKNSECHVIARTVDGKVYCWGLNVSGVLGNGKNDYITYKPQLNQYLSDKQIIDICCGVWHSLVLTNSGDVYAWGRNTERQIGNTSIHNQFIPIKVNGFNNEKVIQISCGSCHSMALTESGRVLSWGLNQFGQLGLNNTDRYVNKPSNVLLSNAISIKKISCGAEHSLLLSRNGNIYWFGNNGIEIEMTPKKLIINKNKFIDIASHYNHYISIALSVNGIYYIWGNCGENDKIKEPKETRFESFDDIFNHFFGITYKTTKIERLIDLKIKLMKNGKYFKECKEIEKLGEGYYGQVFRVENDQNEEYAIKKMKFTIDNEDNILKELQNFFIVNNLNYSTRNILQLNGLWLENNQTLDNKSEESLTLYMQMELCDKTLEEVIKELKNNSNLFRNKTLTLLGYYIACHIFFEILFGVNYLHTRKPQILHKDLHSGNILLKKRYIYNYSDRYEVDVKIADFGLAKICEFAQKSQTIRSKRSPNYKSSSNGSYSTRDDIYSLGEIMNELFSIDTNRYSI
jgi:alpha-tubulin suppressor-like RCC1 family protein